MGATILRKEAGERRAKLSIAGRNAVWIGDRFKHRGAVLYLHGGGYVFGSVKTHHSLMTAIAHAADAMVLGIDYRLAPEHPCPAAIEDALAAYSFLLDKYDASEIVIAGDSAGGGLTAATLLAIRDEKLPPPAAGVLLSPWTDLRCPKRRLVDQGYDYLKPAEHWGEPYGADLGTDDPRVSPVLADLHDLPPMLVLTGELELLAEDNRNFVEAATAAGCDIEHHIEQDQVHVYPAFFQFNSSSKAGIEQIGAFVRRHLDGTTSS
jgi:acetyl esterase/lipase